MPDLIRLSPSQECLRRAYQGLSSCGDISAEKDPAQVDAFCDPIEEFIASQSSANPGGAAARLLMAAALVEPLPTMSDRGLKPVYSVVKKLMTGAHKFFAPLSNTCREHDAWLGDGGLLNFMLLQKEGNFAKRMLPEQYERVRPVFNDLRKKMLLIPAYMLQACLMYSCATEEQIRVTIGILNQPDFYAWAKLSTEMKPLIELDWQQREGNKVDLSLSTLPKCEPADADLVRKCLHLFNPGIVDADFFAYSDNRDFWYEKFVACTASDKSKELREINFDRAMRFMEREDVQAYFKASPELKNDPEDEISAFLDKIFVRALKKANLPTNWSVI